MNRKEIVLVLILVAIAFISCRTNSTGIYVSPLGNNDNSGTEEMPVQTIEEAFERAIKMRGVSNDAITIHLLEGDYHLSEPLVITTELNNLSIVGEGSDKVSVKGSKVLRTNWKAFNENIWVTDIQDDIDFDQLFIGGERQVLARYPNFDENGGYWQGHAGDAISKERVATWENPVGGFVHAMHKGRWGDFHYEITAVSIDEELSLIGGHQNNRPSPMHPEFRMVENIFEELDSEGEWYLDRAEMKLYIWPVKDVDLNTATVEASLLKQLIEIQGTAENPVKNIHIEGICFQHARRTFMEAYHPLLRSDWTIYRGGAILLSGTEYCSLSDC
jgi:hypothetical protein